MQLNSIFSISIGIASLAEYLVPARELFIENKDVFKISTIDNNTRTTLEHYTNPPQVSHIPSEKLNAIKEAILGKAYEYVAACGYDLSTYKLKVSNIWLNEMAKNSHHTNHYHYGVNISGCFYVDMPQDCGQIKFSHTFLSIDPLQILGVANYTPANSSTWSFSPKEGDVFFWKSTLQHEVPQTNIEGIRRCIAFDILVSR
jgi:uncharacterized protein (TIGR02466 family)